MSGPRKFLAELQRRNVPRAVLLYAGAVWALAQGQVPYPAALATVLLGAVAGLISRIPAGLGVLEAVGTAVLSAWLPATQALAVMLAFRALYYLAPLAVAALALLATELLWRRRAPQSGAGMRRNVS